MKQSIVPHFNVSVGTEKTIIILSGWLISGQSPLLDIILNQLHLLMILITSLPKIHLYVILTSPSWSSKWTFPGGFPTKILQECPLTPQNSKEYSLGITVPPFTLTHYVNVSLQEVILPPCKLVHQDSSENMSVTY